MKTDFRKPAVDALIELAKKDDQIVFITCDVGFSFLEPLKEILGKRYLNLGVTECSAMTIASALALSGFKPYIYSMINFMLFRPAEMVRNAVVCHNANVKILGVSGSEKYKFLGFSHNLLHEEEDFDFCDNIGLSWYYPRTEDAARKVIFHSYNSNEPVYIRL